MILWVGVCLYGCATVEDARILDRQVQRLYSQQDKIQQEQGSLKNEMVALRNDLNTETKKLQADLLLRLETFQSEIRNLSTGFEEYKEFSKRPSKDVDRIREDMISRIKILEEKEKNFEEKSKSQEERAKALEEKTKEIENRFKGLEGKSDRLVKPLESEKSATFKESWEGRGLTTAAGDLYKDAYETFQKGDLEGARRKFEAFLKQYPNTELSDNAQFWIGETYYLKKDFEKAILEYEKTIAKYPEGDKIPAAIFKQALSFLELGDKANAKNLLKRVVERYPQSDQAEMAKKKLEGIK